MAVIVPEDKIYERNVSKYVMMPAGAIGRHKVVEARDNILSQDGCNFAVNGVYTTVCWKFLVYCNYIIFADW